MLDVAAFSRQLEIDLDWREAEFAVFREMLTLTKPNTTRSRTLFRAGWALLYAHYEGYCKFCLDLYLDALSRLLPDCHLLPDPLLVFLLKREIGNLRKLPAIDIHQFITSEYEIICNSPPSNRQVDTQSNLWPELLRNLLNDTAVGTSSVDIDDRKLKTLVARRNDIAHGKKVFIDDLSYYADYEYAVMETMYSLTLAATEKYGGFVGQLTSEREI